MACKRSAVRSRLPPPLPGSLIDCECGKAVAASLEKPRQLRAARNRGRPNCARSVQREISGVSVGLAACPVDNAGQGRPQEAEASMRSRRGKVTRPPRRDRRPANNKTANPIPRNTETSGSGIAIRLPDTMLRRANVLL